MRDRFVNIYDVPTSVCPLAAGDSHQLKIGSLVSKNTVKVCWGQ